MRHDPSSSDISGEDVQAWIDGELSESDSARVEAAVDNSDELTALAERLRRQNEMMRVLHKKNAANKDTSAGPPKTEELVRKPFAYAAAILFGFGFGWLGNDWVQRKTVEANWNNEALQVYDFLTEDSFWSVDFSAEDTIALDSLTERLFGRQLPIPNLAERGFAYAGAKVLPAWDGSNIHLIYRDTDQRLVTVTLSAGKNLSRRFRPRVVNFERLRFQTRQVGSFGVSIAAPKDDDTLDFVSAKVFSVIR